MTDANAQGRIFGERYEIRRRIARGGMADVYLAQDQLLDRPVALKVLFAELSVDPSFVERFRREAQNAAKLSHPNIVSVYDWGEDDNTYYIVMEYIGGQSLSALLREEGSLPAGRAAQIGAEVASALSFAHRNGVVHRDVKPGNVLIDERGVVKVTDFGIARARNTTENLTQTGAVMGTATYFSPEQAQGLPVDQRSDVYSLGVVLYEMIAGKAPFSGDNPVTIALQHVREVPVPLRTLKPNTAPAFAAIADQAMAKAPAARYATAEDLRNDLERFLHQQPVLAATAAMPNATQVVPMATALGAYGDNSATTAVPSAARQAPPLPPDDDKSVKGPFLVLVGLIALILIGGLVLLTDNSLISRSDDQVSVPDVVGRNVEDAEAALKEMGLRSNVTRQDNEAAVGTVIAQDPPANATTTESKVVNLTVSSGPPEVRVPDLTGRSFDEARDALVALGLEAQRVDANSDTVTAGNVISQSPGRNTELEAGEQVTLTVSSGARSVKVPDVVGFTQSTAAERLSQSGLRTNSVTQPSQQPSGTVIATNPEAGADVQRNSTVTITVSSGPAATTTTTSSTTTTTKPRDDDERGNSNSRGGRRNESQLTEGAKNEKD